jgi:hypothetical protein
MDTMGIAFPQPAALICFGPDAGAFFRMPKQGHVGPGKKSPCGLGKITMDKKSAVYPDADLMVGQVFMGKDFGQSGSKRGGQVRLL